MTCHARKVCRNPVLQKTCMHTEVSDHQSPPFHINIPPFNSVEEHPRLHSYLLSTICSFFVPLNLLPLLVTWSLCALWCLTISTMCVWVMWLGASSWALPSYLFLRLFAGLSVVSSLSSLLCLTVIRQVCCVRVLECVYMSSVSVFL